MVNKTLKMLRMIHGYKAKELAAKLGCSSSTICEIEVGNKNVTVSMLGSYSKVLNIPASAIMQFAEKYNADPEGIQSMVAQAITDIVIFNTDPKPKLKKG